jgi:antitoxin (DNA-binding transcriptional repressor) of toxin-antitoxin stability system
MIEVGVRQLKDSLPRYLRLVEKGQSILVMRRNRPVALFCKPDRTSARTEEEIVAALIAEGKLIGPVKPRPFRPFKPLKIRGKPLSQTIIEDRR